MCIVGPLVGSVTSQCTLSYVSYRRWDVRRPALSGTYDGPSNLPAEGHREVSLPIIDKFGFVMRFNYGEMKRIVCIVHVRTAIEAIGSETSPKPGQSVKIA